MAEMTFTFEEVRRIEEDYEARLDVMRADYLEVLGELITLHEEARALSRLYTDSYERVLDILNKNTTKQ